MLGLVGFADLTDDFLVIFEELRVSNVLSAATYPYAARRQELTIQRLSPRNDRKPARKSVDKSSGCSQAAKWPPLSCLL